MQSIATGCKLTFGGPQFIAWVSQILLALQRDPYFVPLVGNVVYWNDIKQASRILRYILRTQSFENIEKSGRGVLLIDHLTLMKINANGKEVCRLLWHILHSAKTNSCSKIDPSSREKLGITMQVPQNTFTCGNIKWYVAYRQPTPIISQTPLFVRKRSSVAHLMRFWIPMLNHHGNLHRIPWCSRFRTGHLE